MDLEKAIHFDGIMNAVNNFILFGVVFLVRKGLHREGLGAFLLHFDRRGWKLFSEGMVVGFLSFLLYPIFLILSGQGTVTLTPEVLPRTVALFFTSGFGFLAVALFEEGLFRGYILLKLLDRLSKPVAIVLVSIPFGIFHIISYPTSKFLWLGLLNATLFGVFMSLVVIYSASLMWTVGFHLAWNLIQTLSLMNQNGSVEVLFNIKMNEGLLTGYHYTLEEGLFVTIIAVILFFYTFVRFRQQIIKPELQASHPA